MIHAGDVILVRGNTPVISRMIRWVTGSEYTHVGLAVNEDLILEIDINRDLAIRPISRHEDYDVYRYRHGLDPKQIKNMREIALHAALINKGYDWVRILQFACEKLFYSKKAFHDKNRVICSEFIDNIYAYVGIDLVPDKQDGNVTPGQISASPLLIKVSSSVRT